MQLFTQTVINVYSFELIQLLTYTVTGLYSS